VQNRTMKSHIPLVSLAALVASISSASADQFSPASLSIGGDGGSGASVTVADPANRLWVLQTSTNFITWIEAGTWKIYNGSFRGTLPVGNSPNGFFRAFYDVNRQDIANTTQNALRLPGVAFNYAAPTLPPNFLVPPISTQDNTPITNVITDAGATLGRVLFYDKRLSTNQTIACASCHQPQHGFSDSRRFSLGFNGGATGRNSMGLTQARYYPRGHFFWDERAATLEDQVLQPIQNPVEMGMTLPSLVQRLGAEPYYTNLFAQAFGSTQVTSDRISRALAQFVRSIVSTRSKYDRAIPVNFANFTAEEVLGREIFLGRVGNATCAACHGTDNFVPNNIFNNGLENPYVDKGVGGITGRVQDEGVFKIPSLRNIELTAPYMHDGRFASLEEVVEFYNSGVTNHPNLSPPLRVPTPPGAPPGPPRRLNLTAEQKAALVAFLKTLTDTTVTTDPKFSDPFNYGN
jgi:cytochrome c peroxidase